MNEHKKIILFVTLLLMESPALADATRVPETSSRSQRLVFSVTPEHLVLGESTEANVRIMVRSADGGRASCEDLRIFSSTGEVSDIRLIGSGEYMATFFLPEDYFPRFAIIAAAASCGQTTITGSTTVALYGSGTVEVKSKPHSDVTLVIAADEFGPERTDGKGKVKIPIIVAPGIKTGVAGDKVIDLNLPAVNRIVAIPEITELNADTAIPGIIWIYAIDDSGRPLIRADLKINAGRGTISKLEAIEPGTYRAHYVPPTKVADGYDSVSISLRGDDTAHARASFRILPGMPAALSVTLDPTRYRAGSGAPISLGVRVTDKNGNPTASEVTASSDLGTLAPIETGGAGPYQTTLSLPNRFDGKKQARITIFLKQNPKVTSTVAIALEPAPPATVTLGEVTNPVPTDGLSTTMIPVSIFDPFGNPVRESDLNIEVSATVGSTPAKAQFASGEYHIPFTPPLARGRSPEESRVSADLGQGVAKTTVPLTNRTYVLALSPKIGYLTNLSRMHVPYFSAEADFNLWFIFNGFHAVVDIGYYFSRAEETLDKNVNGTSTTDTIPFRFKSNLHALPVSGSLAYRIKLNPWIYLSMSGGVGAHPIWNVGTRYDQQSGAWKKSYTIVDNIVLLGIHGALTAGFRAGPGHIITKIEYVYVSSASETSSISGRLGGLGLLLGYRFKLF